MADPILKGIGLKLVKGDRVILDLPSFQLMEGETVGLIGPNGAGKSSLMRLLAFLEHPTEGEVWFRGRQPRAAAEILAVRRQMAAVFQEPHLLRGTVYYNAALGLRLRGLNGSAAREKVEAWLERFGVAHLAGRSAANLSSGEAQRVSLARAFVVEPKVLFLDEPFANVDSPTRAALLGDLRQILEEGSVSAIYVTHDFRDLPQVADRVVTMLDGRTVEAGKPRDLAVGNLNAAVAAFLRASEF